MDSLTFQCDFFSSLFTKGSFVQYAEVTSSSLKVPAPFQANFKRTLLTLLTLPPCCNTGFCGKITASAIHLESPLYPSRVPLLQHLSTGLGDRVSSQPGNCIQVNGLSAVKQTETQTSTASD